MKFIAILLLSITLLSAIQSAAFAQTSTPKPAKQSVTDTLSEGITDLKEKIASRVAELDLVEKKGIVGVATEVEDTQITLTDIYGETRIIDVDEITNFASPDEKASFGISDIETGTKISVLGLYNKETSRLLARFVNVVSIPKYIVGSVTQTDEDEFRISVTGLDNVAYTVDVETSTTTQAYVDEDFERAGFSDIETGQNVFITGFEDEKDPSTISASRILIFEESDETQTDEKKTPLSPTQAEDEE